MVPFLFFSLLPSLNLPWPLCPTRIQNTASILFSTPLHYHSTVIISPHQHSPQATTIPRKPNINKVHSLTFAFSFLCKAAFSFFRACHSMYLCVCVRVRVSAPDFCLSFYVYHTNFYPWRRSLHLKSVLGCVWKHDLHPK